MKDSKLFLQQALDACSTQGEMSASKITILYNNALSCEVTDEETSRMLYSKIIETYPAYIDGTTF